MRLNWVAPLPPAVTALAEYSRRVLPLLAGRAELVLWTEQEPWDRAAEAWGTVRRLRAGAIPWHELNTADATLIHLDRGAVTAAVGEVLAAHPAVAVLHGEPDLAWPLERALGLVVFTRPAFERFARQARWPVVLAPPDADAEYLDALLALPAQAGRLAAHAVGNELARQVAAQLAVWAGPTTGRVGWDEVARQIHALTPNHSHRPTRSVPRRAA
jgi:hypothetical protein